MVVCRKIVKILARNGGFSLAEVATSLVILGVAMVPIFRVLNWTLQDIHYSDDELYACQLARDLMEEIVALPFSDPQEPNSFGCEEAPISPREGRLEFDDVDDYTIYTQSGEASWNPQRPPRSIDGNPILDAARFTRKASVHIFSLKEEKHGDSEHSSCGRKRSSRPSVSLSPTSAQGKKEDGKGHRRKKKDEKRTIEFKLVTVTVSWVSSGQKPDSVRLHRLVGNYRSRDRVEHHGGGCKKERHDRKECGEKDVGHHEEREKGNR